MHKRGILYLFPALILWSFILASLEVFVSERSLASGLDRNTCMSVGFREQKLPLQLYRDLKDAGSGDFLRTDLLTATMLEEDFEPEKIYSDSTFYIKYKKEEFLFLEERYSAVWSDIRYFPVASEDVFFENTWMEPVEYEGKECHEGSDLFGDVKEPGYYPVISMTDGKVEFAGWQNAWGYSAGIRAPEGGFFFYAHLASFDTDLAEGGEVEAGDIIGYMGNTGFGFADTRGRIPVHLHLGVYISGPDGENVSVNPYWILKIFAKKTRKYTY